MPAKQIFKTTVKRVRKRVYALGSEYTRYFKSNSEKKMIVDRITSNQANSLVRKYAGKEKMPIHYDFSDKFGEEVASKVRQIAKRRYGVPLHYDAQDALVKIRHQVWDAKGWAK